MRTKVTWAAMAALVALMLTAPALRAQMAMPGEEEQAAALQDAVAAGKGLYNDPTLGGGEAGVSCNTCHPDGGTTGGQVEVMGMQMPIPDIRNSAATFPKWKPPKERVMTLGEMNNACIVTFVKGKPLALDDPAYAQLAAYVTSLAQDAVVYPQLLGEAAAVTPMAPGAPAEGTPVWVWAVVVIAAIAIVIIIAALMGARRRPEGPPGPGPQQ